MKGMLRILIVFLLNRKRSKSIQTVKTLVRQFGEWSRIKRAMFNISRNVRRLQKAARDFLALKRHRCDLIAKDWERIEDGHLVKFYKMYAELIVKEANEKAETRKGSKPGVFNTINRGGLGSRIDWKQFRIPAEQRIRMIGRFYMATLRRHVLGRENLARVFQQHLDSEKDMMDFLKSIGADVSTSQAETSSLRVVRLPPLMWRPAEAVVLNMIALAAQDLQLANVLPFRDHAYSKEIKGNKMFRGSGQALRLLRQQLLSSRMDPEIVAPVVQEVDHVGADNDHETSRDIDDILDNFMPQFQNGLDV